MNTTEEQEAIKNIRVNQSMVVQRSNKNSDVMVFIKKKFDDELQTIFLNPSKFSKWNENQAEELKKRNNKIFENLEKVILPMPKTRSNEKFLKSTNIWVVQNQKKSYRSSYAISYKHVRYSTARNCSVQVSLV